MNADEPKSAYRPSAVARAEAAAWIARLHGPNRTPEVEAGLRRWMGEDPERAAAFELLTDTWEKSARLRRRPFEHVASWELPGFRVSFSRAAFAGMAVAVIAAIGTALYLRTNELTTTIGEQRTHTLDDGTRVYLNTDTRIAQHYDSEVRRVELERGEALFEVAKNENWPFIVTAGDTQVRALGTAFVVRREGQNLAVTLVEGKVTVAPIVATSALPASGDGERESKRERTSTRSENEAMPPPHRQEFTLSPGERLTFESRRPPLLDRPSLDRVTAWQRGQVALDNTLLADAVAEMNRYSHVRLVIEDPQVAAIPVSGVFRAGDQEDFARAVAKTYQLQIRNESRQIILVGRPSGAAGLSQ